MAEGYEPNYVDSDTLASTIASLTPITAVNMSAGNTYKVTINGVAIICGIRLGGCAFARMYEFWNPSSVSLINSEALDGLTITKAEGSNDIYITMPSPHGVVMLLVFNGTVKVQ